MSKLNRSETVTVRFDPRLNYLCDLAARAQRRTKSSFIEWAVAQAIDRMHQEKREHRLTQLSQLFDEPVVGLSVPGMEDGKQCVAITFATGENLTVESDSVKGAWALLFEAAFERASVYDCLNAQASS